MKYIRAPRGGSNLRRSVLQYETLPLELPQLPKVFFWLYWNSLVAQFSMAKGFPQRLKDIDRAGPIVNFIQLCLRYLRKAKEWKGGTKQVAQKTIE